MSFAVSFHFDIDAEINFSTPLSLHCASTLLNTLPHLLPLYPILGSMPASWPLNIVSPFFVRSIRRGTHKRWEGMVRKGIARGEFAEVEERWLEEMRGMVFSYDPIRRNHS